MRCNWRRFATVVVIATVVVVLWTTHNVTSHDKKRPLHLGAGSVFSRTAGTARRATGSTAPPSITIFAVLRDHPDDAIHAGHQDRPWQYMLSTHLQSVLAVSSWLALPVEVLLFGAEPTCALFQATVFATQHRAPRCLPFPCSLNGTPTLDCLFAAVSKKSSTKHVVYANADIVLFHDFVTASSELDSQLQRFVAVGRRLDLNITGQHTQPLQVLPQRPFDLAALSTSLARIQASANAASNHDAAGIDFFLFQRQRLPKVPAFLIGRIEWDNWVLLQAILDPNVSTVDITRAADVVHLNHGGAKESHRRWGTVHNQRLAQQLPHPRVKMTPLHHPGTIWLGRIDNTELELVQDNKTSPLAIVPRRQAAFDLLLYEQHALLQEQRYELWVITGALHNKMECTTLCFSQAAPRRMMLSALLDCLLPCEPLGKADNPMAGNHGGAHDASSRAQGLVPWLPCLVGHDAPLARWPRQGTAQ
eukprot:m.301385 g.301385  ORF g.301385 m.301385 type:complete len:476 (+) comp19567_c0_seq3:294-1721(+)